MSKQKHERFFVTQYDDDLALYRVPARDSNGWVNFQLTRARKKGGRRNRRQKRNWHLAWNGERLARSKDAIRLANDHPEIWAWLIDRLTLSPEISAAPMDYGNGAVMAQ